MELATNVTSQSYWCSA